MRARERVVGVYAHLLIDGNELVGVDGLVPLEGSELLDAAELG